MESPDLFHAPKALSLLQLTTAIGNAVRMTPVLQGTWVTAELSDVRVSGGHCYMELIEKNQAGQTVAKLRAAIWASRLTPLRRKFYQATGRDIATGMKVMLFGAATHHPLYGLSFTINDIDPSYTLGDMERLRREILDRLRREGILDRNRATAMSVAPQRIAVISAAGAAGYGDFISQLEGNPYGFVFYPCLFPAVMQGERTSASVREALEFIEQTIDLWDCVAIVRGGGATTDLNGFDDYELAKAVATFPLPIVVGIGHERDRTVLDEIAHTRMKTPTAVAAFFIDALHSASDHVCTLIDSIVRQASERLLGEERRLANCQAMIPVLANARIAASQALLDKTIARLPALAATRIASARGHLDTISRLAATLSANQTKRASQRLEDLTGRLRTASGNLLRREEQRLDALKGMAAALSPDNTLRRGYSITRINGKAVTDASTVKTGDILETTLRSGTIVSSVGRTSEPDNQ